MRDLALPLDDRGNRDQREDRLHRQVTIVKRVGSSGWSSLPSFGLALPHVYVCFHGAYAPVRTGVLDTTIYAETGARVP